MSKRRIRRRPNEAKAAAGEEKIVDFSFYAYVDPETGMIGLASYSWEISREDLPHLPKWREAHALLPPDYSFAGPANTALIAAALETAKDAHADPSRMLEALAVLGHSPSPKSLETLESLGHGDGPFAGIARLAFNECAAMLFPEEVTAC